MTFQSAPVVFNTGDTAPTFRTNLNANFAILTNVLLENRDTIQAGEVCTVYTGEQHIVKNTLTVLGTLNISGTVTVEPVAGVHLLDETFFKSVTVGSQVNALSAVSIAGALTASSHVISAGVAPTITAGAGAGTGPTVTVAGTDLAGQISVTAGTTPAAGVLATVTFHSTYGATPKLIMIVPANASAWGLQPVVSSPGSASFAVTTLLPSASVLYQFNYVVIQ